jgi:bifunctional DNA-binding transcriptional regulator/antitoxin component of YhaV-PrlF toxin-antitoxin module
METSQKIEYRKAQGFIGERSFTIVLPKQFAVNLGIGNGDFVEVRQEVGKLIIEKTKESGVKFQ